MPVAPVMGQCELTATLLGDDPDSMSGFGARWASIGLARLGGLGLASRVPENDFSSLPMVPPELPDCA